MYWLILLLAGCCEIAWAVALKYTHGFTRPGPSILTTLAMVASVVLLGWAVKGLPLGTAYAVWTGIGTIGTVLLGIYLFDEPATLLRILCVVLILIGIVGLRLAR